MRKQGTFTRASEETLRQRRIATSGRARAAARPRTEAATQQPARGDADAKTLEAHREKLEAELASLSSRGVHEPCAAGTPAGLGEKLRARRRPRLARRQLSACYLGCLAVAKAAAKMLFRLTNTVRI